MTRRGGALIEAVLVVMLLAIAVPPSMRFAEDIGAARSDAVLVERSAMLAQSVVEAIMADAVVGTGLEGNEADGLAAFRTRLDFAECLLVEVEIFGLQWNVESSQARRAGK